MQDFANANGNHEQEVLKVMEVVENRVTAPLNEFTTKSGVILRTRRVKMSLIRDAWKQIKPPEVPKFYIEEKERWEENPADPTYKQAMQDYDMERGDITTNAFIMLGTSVRFVPDNVLALDSDDWMETLDIVGVPRASTKLTRYLQWIKYEVLEDETEIIELLQHITRLSGVVSETDVKEAVDSFRNNTPRDTN